MPTGIVYALWSGIGIVLIAAVSWIWFKQPLDAPAVIGLGLIITGVIVVNVFSTSVSHGSAIVMDVNDDRRCFHHGDADGRCFHHGNADGRCFHHGVATTELLLRRRLKP